jgi:membrane associated rhomboid family serine protease
MTNNEWILYIIIAATGIVTWQAWRDKSLFYKLQFNAYQIFHQKQWYRILSHAFVHVNMTHLLINMIVLFSFGRNIIYIFSLHPSFSKMPVLHFSLLYFGAVVISSFYSLAKQKHNPHYNAVGASGAVSAIAFTSIFFMPWNLIYFFGIIPIPGILFGGAYLVYSYVMGKKAKDNIGHDAHFWGAIFGLAYPMMVDPDLFFVFLKSLISLTP